MKIRIEKIAENENGLPAIPFDQHTPGTAQPENYSIPISYWIEGDLVFPIEVGKSVIINRRIRNGIKAEGQMGTSPVTKVTESTFETLNSVYRYKIYGQ